jgi:anti-sigma-K factor RskA
VESLSGTRPPSDHEAWAELTGPYVLGALSTSDRASFEVHLAGCRECADEVRSLDDLVARLAHGAGETDPPSEVRQRILAAIATERTPVGPTPGAVGAARQRRRANGAWLATAASLAAALALGAYALQLRGRVSDLEARLNQAIQRAALSESQIADARRTASQAESTVAVLTAPDLARIDLQGQPVAPAASARAFWSRSRGLVFTGSNLPEPPARRTYQLWVITADPAPISAGLLMPAPDGRVTAMFQTPPDIAKPVAMAVTLEPEGGVPAPTGDKYLVGLAN